MLPTLRGPVEYASLGTGPAVLALHGAMGGYDQGLILARTACSQEYRSISVSRPGYLKTPLTSGRSPEEQADLCAGLIDELGVDDVAVVAVSGGGPTALQFALRHPDRCRGLVMISAATAKVEARLPLAWYVMKIMARIPAAREQMRKKATSDLEGAARRSFPDPSHCAQFLQDPEARVLFAELQSSVFGQMPQRLPGTKNDIFQTRSNSFDQLPLEKIAVPVLAVHGTADQVAPFAKNAQRFVERVPGARLLAIEGGEHACLFSHRNQIRARVIDFLSGIS